MGPSDMDSVLNTQNATNYRKFCILYNLDPVPNLGNMHTPIPPAH